MTEVDRARIDSLNVPAWYIATPTFDILYANQAASALFPWAVPASSSARRPTNMIEQFMVDPRAVDTVTNWEDVVHRMVAVFRVYAPGVIATDRILEIVETCSANLKFSHLWHTELDQDAGSHDHIIVRDQRTGQHSDWTMDAYHSARNSRPHELIILTPGLAPAPTM
ncbi:hypothetical protein AB0C34_18130 [Nocardia sp. NPDC049220]|uniref:MmyB family transcriptional regulator n=1 Tax=Nocardia sp. NPDC049220 TaxID=3155273 RepID=UPI00340E2AAD